MTAIAPHDERDRVGHVSFRAVFWPGVRAYVAHVLVVAAVASVIGLVLTHLLEHSSLVSFDRRVVHDLAEARTHTLDRLTGWGTLPADPIPVAIVWLGGVALTALRTKHWRVPCTIMLAVGGEKLSYLVTTLIVRRPRPDVPTIGTRHATSSFPSGHVGSAISLWGSIAFLILVGLTSRSVRARVLAIIPVAIIAIDVALCRMYRGHHYPTDVVVGAAVGIIWIVFAVRIVDRLDRDPARRGPSGRRTVGRAPVGLGRPTPVG